MEAAADFTGRLMAWYKKIEETACWHTIAKQEFEPKFARNVNK
jgi:hypothetical protein